MYYFENNEEVERIIDEFLISRNKQIKKNNIILISTPSKKQGFFYDQYHKTSMDKKKKYSTVQ